MADELQNYLITLHECVRPEYCNISEALNTVQNISKVFEEDLTIHDLGLAVSLLFDEQNGLLRFIQKALKNREFKDALRESFILLKILLQDFKEKTYLYVLQIKKVCQSCIFGPSATSDVKEKALDALKILLENSSGVQDLEVLNLFDSLLREYIQNTTKKPSKVLSKAYIVLGVIAHRYPEQVERHRSYLFRVYCHELDKQIKTGNEVQYPVIAGCFLGLTEYFHKFDCTDKQKVYGYVKCLAAKTDEHFRVAQRAALGIVAKHGKFISEYLFDDYKWWHNNLLTWVSKASSEDHKAGFAALEAFYNCTAETIKQKSDASAKAAFAYFLKYFNEQVEGKFTSDANLKLFIKGFGIFAGACRALLEQKDVNHMFALVVQRAEQMFIKEQGLDDKEIKHLPEYVESLSCIMVHIETMTGEQLTVLERVIVLLIQHYPKIAQPLQWIAIRAITVSLCNLAVMEGTLMASCLSTIVYQGIIRSCSHRVVIDVELQKGAFNTEVTYRNYVHLWNSILSIRSYEKNEIPLAIKKMIVDRAYDEFIRTIIILMKKLDLSTKKKTIDGCNPDKSDADDVPVLDPEKGLQACKPKDFQVFINLVDLSRDVLLSIDPANFEKWILAFSEQVISESSSKPLVSGFYKLLALDLELCDKLNYLILDQHKIEEHQDVLVAQSQQKEHRACYILLCRFLQEIIMRLQQYKNELQVACLQTILAAPVALVMPLVPHAAPAFEAVFRVGQSLLSLAHLGVSALEKWNKTLPQQIMKPLLKQVLPFLDPYLQSKGTSTDSDVITEMELKFLERRTSAFSRRKKRKHNSIKPDSELLKLQQRILSFLGQLDSQTCLALLEKRHEEELTWAHALHPLKFPLPFPDVKVSLNIAKLFPRVVELASSSSNRHIRTAACELLHAFIMLLLGTARASAKTSRDRYAVLFKKLSLPLLKLGCDPDQVVHELYEPLMLQLIHWYSSQFQYKSAETAYLIETLMVGITHPTDAALRDFSSKCVNEFVLWSVRQLNKKQLEDSPVNVKAVLKQIYSFCLHPCASKRLGAALLFNSIYKTLREEEPIVDMFWLELLYYMVENLSLTEEIDSIPGSQEQMIQALDHIERVLKAKKDLFQKASNNRRKPPEFEGVRLQHAVSWLLIKCGCIQIECRHKCMKLVYALAPLLPGCKTPAEFISKVDSKCLFEVCEGGGERDGIAKRPTLADMNGEPNIKTVILWLRMLLTSLDCYIWLFGQKLAKPFQLLKQDSSFSARIFDAIMYFIEHVSQQNAMCVTRLMSRQMQEEDTEIIVISPWEAENFNKNKCLVVERILNFIVCILDTQDVHCLPKGLLNRPLWKMILAILFYPAEFGFELQSAEIVEELPKKLQKCLTALSTNLLPENLLEFQLLLAEDVRSGCDKALMNVQKAFKSDAEVLENKQFIQGLEILQKSSVLQKISQVLPSDITFEGSSIIKSLFSALVEIRGGKYYTVNLEPDSLSYCEALLKFSFALGNQALVLIECINDRTTVCESASQREILHGKHFLQVFKTSVFDHLLLHADDSIEYLLNDITEENILSRVDLVVQLLQHILKNKHTENRRCGAAFEKGIALNWNHIGNLATSTVVTAELNNLLITLAVATKSVVGSYLKHVVIRQWILAQITSNKLTLHSKSRALDLLPCVTGLNDDGDEELLAALQYLRRNHFPQTSSELHQGSPEYYDFVAAFQKILRCLILSGSCTVLKEIVSMTTSEAHHICEDKLQQGLSSFMKRLSDMRQVKAIQTVYEVFTDRDQYGPHVRHHCMQKFLLPLIQLSRMSAALTFFKENVQSLKSTLDSTVERLEGILAIHHLVGKIGAWSLFELMFAKFDSKQLEGEESEIVKAAFPNQVQTGKELLQYLTRVTFKYREQNLPAKLCDNAEAVEFFRKSQCAAYNALVSIVSNTKRESSHGVFYNNFLFSENKGNIWEKLIDCTKTYRYTLDWEEIPKRRKQLVNIRKEVHAQRWGQGLETQPARYIPTTSQYLFDSTLSEDVVLFDYTTSVLQTPSLQTQEMQHTISEEAGAASVTEVSLDEDDEMNTHECMATLCGLIQYMEEKIFPLPDAKEGENISPTPWMKQLEKCLSDSHRNSNVRLFILKLLLNLDKMAESAGKEKMRLKPFAQFWLHSFLKAISDGVAGTAPNFLLTDTIAVLMEWNVVPESNTDIEMANKIVQELISKVEHNRADIFKHNLEVLRTVVEVWKSCLAAPTTQLYKMIKKEPSKNEKTIEAGIHVTGIMLSNKLKPWTTSKSIFLSTLMENLNSRERNVYYPCAEALGMTLKLLDPEDKDTFEGEDETFVLHLKKKLDAFYDSKSDMDKFMYCLFGIVSYYPPFAVAYMNKVLFIFPQAIGGFRTILLKIMLSRLETLGASAYTELKSKDILKILHERDADKQEIILQMFNKMLPLLKDEDLKEVVQEVSKFDTHRSVHCRKIMYDILKWIYTNHKDLSKEAKQTLLKGLIDSDPGLQETFFKFWSNDGHHKEENTFSWLIFQLLELYSPTIEEYFIGYCTKLLLESTAKTPDYNLKIFEQPLHECRFENHVISSSWKAQHATIAPMFAQTLASQLSQSASLGMDGGMSPALLRATQASLAFQPTLDQSVASTSSMSSLAPTSSLMFTIGAIDRRSGKTVPGISSLSMNAEPEDENRGNKSKFSAKGLRKRFHKNKFNMRVHYASLEVRRKQRVEEINKERALRRDANVTMLRQYRKGDFPDIEITYDSVIKPLQELAKRDGVIARQLFVLIFMAVMNEFKAQKPEFADRTEEAISSIICKSQQNTSVLMGTLMEIALQSGIHLQAEAIAAASSSSGLLSLGSLLLEEVLKNTVSDESPSKISTSGTEEQQQWLLLAELYEEMNEWDVVHGIFSSKLDSDCYARTAIAMEASGNWKSAQANYKEALRNVSSDVLMEHYYCSYFKCLKHMSKWQLLNDEVKKQVDNNLDDLWSDSWLQEKLLPFFMCSQVHVQLENNKVEFFDTLQEWMSIPDRAEYLRNLFGEELAVLYLMKGKNEQAGHFIQQCITNFLESWEHLDFNGNKLRTVQLLDLQRITEIQAYLECSALGDTPKYEPQATNLVQIWNANLPSSMDSLLHWDTRVKCRLKFITEMKKKIQQPNFDGSMSSIQLALVKLALQQENFDVANKYLFRTKKLEGCKTNLGLQWEIAKSKCKWLRAQITEDEEEKLNWYLDSWIEAASLKELLCHSPEQHMEILQHISTIARSIYERVEQNPKCINLVKTEKLTEFINKTEDVDLRSPEVLNTLKCIALENLKKAVEVMVSAEVKSRDSVALAYLEVAKYCQILSGFSGDEANEYGADTVRSILMAMRYGSRDARQLFPCVLQMPRLAEELSEVFTEEIKDIPEWMFLAWLNQLLAGLDTAAGYLLHDLVLRIAAAYPQAMVYPFLLTQERYSVDCDKEDLRTLLERLNRLLLNEPVMNNFLKAFSSICQPCLLLIHHVEALKSLLADKKVSSSKIKHAYDSMMNAAFPENQHGKAFAKIKPFEAMLKQLKPKILGRAKTCAEDLSAMQMMLRAESLKTRAPTLLKDYSPWLNDFQASRYSFELEIPGQYTGESKPLLERHIKISSFKESVLVLSSMRVPLRITILGNDAKEYNYLVKFGEDLRQDDRLQQLFKLMNKILLQDPACRNRNLSITSYQVIPFTSCLGMIQWVDGTKILKSLLTDIMNDDEKKNYNLARKKYSDWIKKHAGNREGDTRKIYGEAFKKYSYDATVAAYREKVNMIPMDILRRALEDLSISYESFFTLRQNFACSHAVLCVAHWLLGVGDRHLQNTLVSLRDGTCIGIDFGHAFGTATQLLRVPELMPFRLTPHIVSLMEPLEEKGLFRETMIHTLHALRSNCHMLLATMAVFVQEPTMDWLKYARKNPAESCEDGGSWYPKRKIELARKKLRGFNPIIVMEEELKDGHAAFGDYLRKYLEAVKGPPGSIRSTQPRENLSPEIQINCLLEQAMDYNILGKTYEGWESWV